MPAVPNQINLQTSFSKLSVLYYLLKVVKDNEPTTRTQTRNTLFPIARSKLKSTTTPWDPSKADTHARITLEEYGLIEYDSSDDEKFSVSKLGNDFLSSFNLILNPAPGGLVDPEISLIADQDEATYLIWRILCATRIVDGTYDIHPYRILMALLLRQELKGRITKREWAHFLVNTNYSRDEKLDFIESSLKCFRSSAVLQDIKSTDRVLGRLKDWNVIVPVSGTTGDAMAYTMKDSFKWVAYSNLTKKELAMNDKDIDIIKKLFEDWAQTQPSLRGGNITLPVAQHYSYELEKDVEDPLFAAIPYSNLFQITEAERFRAVKAAVEAVQGFANFDNTRGNGYFSRAMTLYDCFLNDPIAYMEVKKMLNLFLYLAAIRTKPFILLAGISGTGKSRLVRQLAKGCCKADSELVHGNEPGNFASIAVRPNWHDSTELIGYVSRLGAKPRYVITDFVRFLAKAWLYEDTPFFLCLDEMNLAPVEQYFAEYLSVVESRSRNGENKIESDVLIKWTDDEIRKGALEELFGEDASPNVTLLKAKIDADKGLRLPPNLIVMGTVNMDETTFSFSRKVLDRAMSFELNEVDMDAGLQQCNDVEYGSILADSAKASLIKGCEAYAADQALCDKVKSYLIAINERLEGTSFKIAYRTRDEMMIYCIERTKGGLVGLVQALDEATSMKILSRIEGDTDRITEAKLTSFRNLIVGELLKVDGKAGSDAEVVEFLGDAEKVKASACCTKLNQMIKTVHDGAGFVSFWQC